MYPEYLPRAMWRDMFRKVKAGGIDMVRFAEFAWALMEPDEGVFNWEVFDAAFDMAAEEGLQVVLCTPTATPPLWLCEKYPDVLPVNENGDTVVFGGRQHRCYNSVSSRKYSKIIAEEMAKRYGKRPNLFAWQIDNELAAEHKYCFCPTCRKKFQDMLAAKYGTIENLNERWLGTFWSQRYQRFDQIMPPRENDAFLPVKPHPSLMYEFHKFSSDSVIDYAHMQYDAIRAYSDAPITTNQDDFSMGDNTDWFKMFNKLDVAAFDIYSPRAYEYGFYFDLAYSIKHKPCWILEYGTGFDGLADMMDVAEAKGCGLTGLFAFHPFTAGQEQGPGGFVDAYGKESANYFKFRDWSPKNPKPQRKLLFHYDYESSWSYAALEHHTWEEGFWKRQNRLVYQKTMIHTIYKAAFDTGCGADFPADLSAFGKGDTLVMPMQIIHKPALAADVLAFVQRGGRLLTTSDIFLKNEDNAFIWGPTDFHKAVMGGAVEIIPDGEGKPAVLREYTVGEGHVTVMSLKASEADWKAIFESL